MKIIKLVAENIKRIKSIEITPDGAAILITGKNGQGKSSTLDAIEMVLGGKDAIPSRPIRDGETTARIVCETEKYIITRHWTSLDATYLKVELKGEGILGSPQKILDQLVGELSFDPLEFSTLDSKERLKMLKAICKLDFTKLDAEYAQVYEKRKEAHKAGEIHKATFESFGNIDMSYPSADLDKIKEIKAAAMKRNDDIRFAERNIASRDQRIVALREQNSYRGKEIKRLEDEVARLQNARETDEILIKKLEEEKSELIDTANEPLEDLAQWDDVFQEWAHYEANQKLIAKKKEADEKLVATRKTWEELNQRLTEINFLKNRMVSEAPMPIDGLGLGEGEVLFKGIPFAQLSTSEQIRISMAIAMALNPKLRVIIIKNASLLDKAAMDEVVKIAEMNDFQIWMEKVAEGPEENCIYIEDGQQVVQQ